MTSTFFNLPKIKPRKTVWIGVSVSLLAGGVLLSQIIPNHVLQKKETEKEQVIIPEVKTVTALGRLEPEGEVIEIAASSSGQGGGQGKQNR